MPDPKLGRPKRLRIVPLNATVVRPDSLGPFWEAAIVEGFQESLRDALMAGLIARITFEPGLITDPSVAPLLKPRRDFAYIMQGSQGGCSHWQECA